MNNFRILRCSKKLSFYGFHKFNSYSFKLLKRVFHKKKREIIRKPFLRELEFLRLKFVCRGEIKEGQLLECKGVINKAPGFNSNLKTSRVYGKYLAE